MCHLPPTSAGVLQTFGDSDDTRSVYHYTVQPLVALMFKRGGRGTCFAYGQTGSVSPLDACLPAARPSLAAALLDVPPPSRPPFRHPRLRRARRTP